MVSEARHVQAAQHECESQEAQEVLVSFHLALGPECGPVSQEVVLEPVLAD